MPFEPRIGTCSEPVFTAQERVDLRQMLREFRAIKTACPMARRLLDDD